MTSQNELQRDEGEAIVPVPNDAPETLFQHRYLGMPTSKWPYHTADGKVAMVVCRYIDSKGKKSDLPWTYREYKNGKKDWANKSIPVPRLLFNLHEFARYPEKTILICEGEKATEAAGKIFPEYVCTTSPNGASNGKASSWLPVIDRDVVIYPDNDQPGQKHAQQVAQLCLKAGARSVAIVEIPPDIFPEKWDLADTLPEDWTLEDVRKLIEQAKEISNPIENLIERTKLDPGLPFTEDVLLALAELKATDISAFEKIRVQLKAIKVRVTELDKALKGCVGSHDIEEEPSQSEILLMLACETTLFHDPDKNGYADIEINGHVETWSVRSKGFKRWLSRRYYEFTEGKVPNSESVNAAINTIEANAYYDGKEKPVFIRVASYNNKTYIDLCNEAWEVIEVDADGWRIIANAPAKFRRTAGMLPLPKPSENGSLENLRSILNVRSESDFILAVSWLIAALRGAGPYPVLVLTGEHGTAKSSFSKLMRALVDPNGSPLRTLREERDMFIAASNGHVLAFDNISGMTASTSDTLCRLSTGGALATRQLFTDQDEVLLNVVRPIILNGIDDVITRPDLGDRALVLTLKPIPEEDRRLERELFNEFEEATPAILGALLDALSDGYTNFPNTRLTKLPRMADFALWATACSETLWGHKDSFINAFDSNRADAIEEILDADPVVTALICFMELSPQWKGTMQELLRSLAEIAGHEYRLPKQWPVSPRGLSGQLRRSAPFLRKIGIEILFDEKAQDRNRSRLITITKTLLL